MCTMSTISTVNNVNNVNYVNSVSIVNIFNIVDIANSINIFNIVNIVNSINIVNIDNTVNSCKRINFRLLSILRPPEYFEISGYFWDHKLCSKCQHFQKCHKIAKIAPSASIVYQFLVFLKCPAERTENFNFGVSSSSWSEWHRNASYLNVSERNASLDWKNCLLISLKAWSKSWR